jgi:arylsulfatase A-like enzyme
MHFRSPGSAFPAAARGLGGGIVATVLLAAAGCGPVERPGPARPSFVVIDIDTLRADRLGLYGNGRPTSPNIDAWAKHATVFDWAFAQAPNTPPSQASILSGLYPSSHGRVDNDDVLRPEAVTLAEALRDAGYRTAAFVDGGFMSAGFGVEQGFEVYDNSQGGGLAAVGPKALAWIAAQGQPYFVLIHSYDVHSPYQPRPEFRDAVAPGVRPETPGFEPTTDALEEIRSSVWKGAQKQLPPGDLAYSLALYDGEIRQMDAWFGTFHAALQQAGELERAMVVLISDHGEEFQEHGSVLHEKLYATVARIPLVLSPPGSRVGSRHSDIVQSIDLAPTLLRLAGVAVPPTYEGHDLLLPRSERGLAFGESMFFAHQRFLAVGPWRIVHARDTGQTELFRFREDPLEQHDLAAEDPPRAATLREALQRIEAHLGEHRAAPAATATIDEETRKQLESLGYLR